MNKPLLLIDADWLAFSTAIAFQQENPFNSDEEPTYNSGLAWHTFKGRIDKLMGIFETPNIELHYSCNRKFNWRRSVVRSYKMNREGTVAPIGLEDLKERSCKKYPFSSVPTLEADDTIGLKATSLKHAKNCVICSVDKDFLTIPTLIWNPVKKVLKRQTKENAFKAFMYQVITGDTSDGFKGIPKCGEKAAFKLINENSRMLQNIWKPMVKLAKKKGCNENYLISQARLARLLQYDDYNFDTGGINLWSPDKIKEML